MNSAKYIRTEEDQIIVFPSYLSHNLFKSFNPVSAGFISFGATAKHEPSCTCYGKSVSLGIDSNTDEDTFLAKKQILKIIDTFLL